jgi:hypothetical protein
MPDASFQTKLKEALTNVDGIDSVKLYPNSDTVVIKSSLPISVLHEKIESTGQRAVIKGYGGAEKSNKYFECSATM